MPAGLIIKRSARTNTAIPTNEIQSGSNGDFSNIGETNPASRPIVKRVIRRIDRIWRSNVPSSAASAHSEELETQNTWKRAEVRCSAELGAPIDDAVRVTGDSVEEFGCDSFITTSHVDHWYGAS